MAAKGSCTSNVLRRGNIVGWKWSWTSDANGDVDENGSGVEGFFIRNCYGKIISVEVEYDDASNGYDVTIKDHYGIDILKGLGANLVNDKGDAKNRFCPVNAGQQIGTQENGFGPIFIWNDDLEIIVANAGNAKKGYITIFAELPQLRVLY